MINLSDKKMHNFLKGKTSNCKNSATVKLLKSFQLKQQKRNK